MTFLLLIAVTASAQAQDWKAEWDKTVAAAKKEGQLIVMLPPNTAQRDFLTREWPKAFPGIELQQNVITAAQWIQRVRIERQSGKYLWDLAMSGSVATFTVKNDGFTDPIVPELILPEVKDPAVWGGWDKVFYDIERKYSFALRNYLKLPYYNAKVLSPELVAREKGKIFLHPSLKGKVVWNDPLTPSSGESFAPIMRQLLGDDGLTRFVKEQVVFSANMPDLVERTVRGQFAMVLGPIMPGWLDRYKSAGLDVDIRALGNTPEMGAYSNTGGSNTIILKDRPHPNATRVFLNWYMSRAVSAELAKVTGEDSSRLDIPEQVDPSERRVPGVVYSEPQREERHPELRAAQELIKEARQ
jgi:ABC-type Fe3+ transport system substrate-binding protein